MPRKQKKIHYLYKTTCLITNNYYIGIHSTSNINDDYMGSGKRLRYSIRKYGVENHKKEILEYFKTREELIKREIEVVDSNLIKEFNCMNLREGGSGGFTNKQQKLNNLKAQEKLKKLREENPEWVENFKKNCSNALKKTYNEGIRKKTYFYDWKNKKHSEDTKEKMKELMKGKGIGNKNSQYGTCWITNGVVNKKIKKEDLDIFIQEKWIKGRKLK
jgi:hypothetical protein